MPRLVVASPGPIPRRGAEVFISDKTISGISAYATRWAGEVALAGVQAAPEVRHGNLGARWQRLSEMPFAVITGPTLAGAVEASAPDLVMATLTPLVAELRPRLDKCVLVAEFDPKLQAIEAASDDRQGVVSRMRTHAWATKRMRRYRGWVSQARGLQCNGYPAARALADASRNNLTFLDSRLYLADVECTSANPVSSRPVRLAFSGKLHPNKGPEYAIAVAEGVRDLGVQLDVFGEGPLRRDLERSAGSNVHFKGEVDYSTEWLPYVRDHIDLMVLPHTQSDPSCTYLEAAGSGAPVLGFDNAALSSLVDRFAIGWTETLRDTGALVAQARQLVQNPSEVARARGAGLALMRRHHADAEFDRRVAHLTSLI